MTEIIDEITAALRAAYANATECRERLLLEGVYDALPRQSWETRGGSEYLYLLFGLRPTSGHFGPSNKRKLYVGADPEKVAAARAQIERTRQAIDLEEQAHRLTNDIANTLANIDFVHRHNLPYLIASTDAMRQKVAGIG